MASAADLDQKQSYRVPHGFFTSRLSEIDPAVEDAIHDELRRNARADPAILRNLLGTFLREVSRAVRGAKVSSQGSASATPARAHAGRVAGANQARQPRRAAGGATGGAAAIARGAGGCEVGARLQHDPHGLFVGGGQRRPPLRGVRVWRGVYRLTCSQK